jgi:hypothetical protein
MDLVCALGDQRGARTRSTLKEGIFDRQFPTLLKKRKQNGVCVLLQNRAALKSIALGLLSFKNHTFREMTSSN